MSRRDEYDVVIVGAGPAGLTAARELAEHGKSVLVLEKNAEVGPKVCAGGIGMLEKEIEIPFHLADRRLRRLRGHFGGRARWVERPGEFLAIFDRGKLGRYMADQALDRGAELQTSATVTAIEDSGVVVNGDPIRFGHLIGADGSNSVVRRSLPLPRPHLGATFQFVVPREVNDMEVFFDKQRFGSGYGWIVPHDGYTQIGFGVELAASRGRNLKEECRNWAEAIGFDLTGARSEAFPICYDYRGWRFGNILLAGDAAGLASALTGEGIYPAMISGREVARYILEPAYRCPQFTDLLHHKARQERLFSLMHDYPIALWTAHRLLKMIAHHRWLSRRAARFLF